MNLDALNAIRPRIRAPVAILLGSPKEAADLVALLALPDATCCQMDLYQAARLREELAELGLSAEVMTAADPWDLAERFQSVVYPAPQGGERILKLDMIEQSFHMLQPRGNFIVFTGYEKEMLFPTALKKVYGRVHAVEVADSQAFWCRREGDRTRRRHEVVYQVHSEEGPSFRFLSRPGTFSYGRLDDGARALVETADIHPGDRILDFGCGIGTNGVITGRRSGTEGSVCFLDSIVRALGLAEHNAKQNGIANFHTLASATAEELAPKSFDVVLANPPYYAQLTIAEMFIARSRRLLKPGGRFYLVTKQPDQVGPCVAEAFGVTEPAERRGYTVLCATAVK